MLIYICEDRKEQLKDLNNLLETISKETKIELLMESYETAEDTYLSIQKRINDNQRLPEIIFLDIKLPGMSGIELGKKLYELAPSINIVFLTAYEEYAIEGYKTRAYRYLLKPIDKNEIKSIIEDINKLNKREVFFLLRDAEDEIILPVSDVRYICAEDKYSVLHCVNNEFLDRRSLNYFEEFLKDNGFFRIHRKYIVNLKYHKGINNGRVILDNNETLPISRRKEALYRTYLFKLLENDILR